MVYCLPAADVPAFIAGTYLAEYVASTNMAVVEILDDPWMEKDVIGSQGYSNSRRITLKFAVVYLDVPWPAGITRPSYRTGTTLKLHTTYGGQYLPLPPAGIKPAAGPVPGPGTQNPLYIALNEYHVEWDRVEEHRTSPATWAPSTPIPSWAARGPVALHRGLAATILRSRSDEPLRHEDNRHAQAEGRRRRFRRQRRHLRLERLVQPPERPMGALQPE